MRNNYLKTGLLFLSVIIISFFIGRCSKSNPTEEINFSVTTPEITDSIKSSNIITPLPSSKPLDSIIYNDKKVYLPEVNDSLLNSYLLLDEMYSEIEKENLKLQKYIEAIKIQNYNTPFEDDNIKINIKSKVQGQLLDTYPIYEIKSKTYNFTEEIPKPKERVFSLNLGAGITTTTTLEKLEPVAKIDIVNKKGNILSISYGSEKTISGTYTFNIFNIRK